MPPASARQLARIRARYQRLAAEFAQVGFMLTGSLMQRFLPCGTPGCHCHGDPPELHGPYWQWSRRVQGKTVSRMLPADQVPRYREWMDTGKRAETIVSAMHDLSAEAAALMLEQQRASRTSPQRAPRRAQTRKSGARR